ncbi:MAG: hypothetical protein A3E21_01665 [Sulfurimonas sp. RIFCSPHIGHO2_12_FULL_36_9]|uniref:hypothetical protein n=1 Tax=Sulfurimonas sp. RIFCSPLOWO2_12_36_12 TaxID=1802253 RepID=UPI0008B170CE|nr:hypothetical protein [Sulfurimonas sp. RIFCSPLOWO2_12_36_12]OHD98247.1 MAG: hypothetical protein A3E21_01665 [Sulfurimonas sp. RIFCSPHIGHO2_12_FULL_36_9]OHD98734.1 MAG: hypothetical protein A3J26_06955 [Sulfurimonas sp. RIFCSPLOWO2_02_FULL_36_28]OHE01779.1 MAG: hypothetical protein A2W82_11005 [Sulfurimonas sp. RIFCSPLOWO2_12_36_12]OHE07174.1 MAG: hypothetical protein A3K14_02010 [Sulfurimonas sp. RIFCSPLOWO2_12_FULL_36_74]
MQDIFLEYKVFIVFLHVISAVVWVGGMIAMRYAAHSSFLEIESPQKRLERIAHALKRLFAIVLPFVIILIVTAVFMIKGYGLSQSDFSLLSHAKEGIWTLMFLNLTVMIFRRNRGERFLNEGNMVGAKNQLELIGKIMVPLNIVLGIVAIFLGTYLSSTL